ncbi:MAG: GrrA/OscA1 family cyclophane-containing rSAM-modified RiPP [Cyanobacteriota bacterium]
MPPSRSAGLLAFLLALPSLTALVPPASDASATSGPPEAAPGAAPGAAPPDQLSPRTSTAAAGEGGAAPADETMEARLRRLSEAIRARAGQLEDGEHGPVPGEPWVAAGAWGNGRGRGWVNRGWSNHGFGNYHSRPAGWANFRPGWGNFRNGPRFINW